MKNQSKNAINAIFLFIGILPGGYILRGIHPPRSIYLMILIYLTFIKTSLLVLKDYSPNFVFRGFVISFGALFLISAGFFMPGDYNHIHSDEYRIGAEKLEVVPEKFTVVTESQIGSIRL